MESDPFEAGAYAYFPIHPVFKYHELAKGGEYNKTELAGVHHIIEDQLNRYGFCALNNCLTNLCFEINFVCDCPSCVLN